jgi:hypothetical protein
MGSDGTRAGLALIIPLLYAADVLTLTALYVVVFIMALVGHRPRTGAPRDDPAHCRTQPVHRG